MSLGRFILSSVSESLPRDRVRFLVVAATLGLMLSRARGQREKKFSRDFTVDWSTTHLELEVPTSEVPVDMIDTGREDEVGMEVEVGVWVLFERLPCPGRHAANLRFDRVVVVLFVRLPQLAQLARRMSATCWRRDSPAYLVFLWEGTHIFGRVSMTSCPGRPSTPILRHLSEPSRFARRRFGNIVCNSRRALGLEPQLIPTRNVNHRDTMTALWVADQYTCDTRT